MRAPARVQDDGGRTDDRREFRRIQHDDLLVPGLALCVSDEGRTVTSALRRDALEIPPGTQCDGAVAETVVYLLMLGGGHELQSTATPRAIQLRLRVYEWHGHRMVSDCVATVNPLVEI
jgi:hypothetical protein